MKKLYMITAMLCLTACEPEPTPSPSPAPAKTPTSTQTPTPQSSTPAKTPIQTPKSTKTSTPSAPATSTGTPKPTSKPKKVKSTIIHSPANFLAKASKLYDIKPNLADCQTGKLNQATKQEFLTTLNTVRKLSGLGAVTYDETSDEEVMQASLMFAATGKTSHFPDKSYRCYSELGAQGAGNSNISGGTVSPYLVYESPEQEVASWLHDARNTIKDNVGHRRWLLDPFLKKVAFGKVDAAFDAKNVVSGSAVKVIYSDNESKVDGNATTELIAYPVNDYPAKYFHKDALLSVVLVPNLANKWDNKAIDYADAKITVTLRKNGSTIPVSKIAYDNQGFGVPNNLQFKINPLNYDTIYDVNINNVIVDGVQRDYQYWFRIVE